MMTSLALLCLLFLSVIVFYSLSFSAACITRWHDAGNYDGDSSPVRLIFRLLAHHELEMEEEDNIRKMKEEASSGSGGRGPRRTGSASFQRACGQPGKANGEEGGRGHGARKWQKTRGDCEKHARHSFNVHVDNRVRRNKPEEEDALQNTWDSS